jgi:hypothetical protein
MNTEKLTPKKCLELLESYGTPPHVVAHCMEVARVATRLAEALNAGGCSLDLRLTETASLLHDMARLSEAHWDVTADILESAGHPEEAGIIRIHMHHQFPRSGSCPTEADIVCLADRIVLEDHFVGLDERMEYIIRKSGGSPEVRDKIEGVKRHVGGFIREIEKRTGESLEETAQRKDETDEHH